MRQEVQDQQATTVLQDLLVQVVLLVRRVCPGLPQTQEQQEHKVLLVLEVWMDSPVQLVIPAIKVTLDQLVV